MGCLPSKSFKGEGHRLGSAPSSLAASPVQPVRSEPIPKQQPKASAAPSGPAGQGPRSMAALAAERRANDAANRGTTQQNPNKGKLSEQLNNQKKNSLPQNDQLPERIVYD